MARVPLVPIGSILIALGLSPGCLVPPAIPPGGDPAFDVEGKRFPPGTEAVELPVADGESLRGVFVPSEPGAPVVLHLLESSGSVASQYLGYENVLDEMAGMGFASLIVDYRGVGRSDGDRSPRNLAADADAMWAEAERRAGGDPGRVVVRAVSIGALAAAILARRDVHPAAWIFIAPVRAESVVRHFAAWQYPGLLGRLAAACFRPVADVDLVATVRALREPLWVVSPADDELLPPDEQARLREAVEAAGGTWTVSSSSHPYTTLGAHGIWSSEEAEMLATLLPGWPDRAARAGAILAELPPEVAARFPPDSPERSRLAEISVRVGPASRPALAAAALAFEDVGAAARLLRRSSAKKQDWLHGLEFEELELVLDLRDPAGDLPIDLVRDWVREFLLARSQGEAGAAHLAIDSILDLARRSEIEAAAGRDAYHEVPMLSGSASMEYPCSELWRSLGMGTDALRSDVRRRAARVLLKAAAIPDRVVAAGDGSYRLEIRQGSGWRALSLDWPEPGASADPPGAGEAHPR